MQAFHKGKFVNKILLKILMILEVKGLLLKTEDKYSEILVSKIMSQIKVR